jgi:cold shock CspA family protein
MGRSKTSFGKREKEKQKQKKREDKARRKAERKAAGKSSPDEMIAYVNHLGEIVDTPPDPNQKQKVKAEDIVIGIPPKEQIEFDPIRQGIVQFFNRDKGYGFIRDLETEEEYYAHVSGLMDDVRDQDQVIFELERGKKGMNAVNVQLRPRS